MTKVRASRSVAAVTVGGLLGSACGGTPAYVPAGPPVSVRFAAANPSRHYVVQIKSGTTTSQCDAPCELSVPSGTATATVTGSRDFTQQLVIPNEPATGTVKEERVTQFFVGYGMAAAFALVGLGAGLAASIQSMQACPSGQWDSLTNNCDYSHGGGISDAMRRGLDDASVSGIVSASGWALAAVGLIIGATSGKNRIDLTARSPTPISAVPRLRLKQLELTPQRQGGAMASANFTF